MRSFCGCPFPLTTCAGHGTRPATMIFGKPWMTSIGRSGVGESAARSSTARALILEIRERPLGGHPQFDGDRFGAATPNCGIRSLTIGCLCLKLRLTLSAEGVRCKQKSATLLLTCLPVCGFRTVVDNTDSQGVDCFSIDVNSAQLGATLLLLRIGRTECDTSDGISGVVQRACSDAWNTCRICFKVPPRCIGFYTWLQSGVCLKNTGGVVLEDFPLEQDIFDFISTLPLLGLARLRMHETGGILCLPCGRGGRPYRCARSSADRSDLGDARRRRSARP